jgi:hypothetical protein
VLSRLPASGWRAPATRRSAHGEPSARRWRCRERTRRIMGMNRPKLAAEQRRHAPRLILIPTMKCEDFRRSSFRRPAVALALLALRLAAENLAPFFRPSVALLQRAASVQIARHLLRPSAAARVGHHMRQSDKRPAMPLRALSVLLLMLDGGKAKLPRLGTLPVRGDAREARLKGEIAPRRSAALRTQPPHTHKARRPRRSSVRPPRSLMPPPASPRRSRPSVATR